MATTNPIKTSLERYHAKLMTLLSGTFAAKSAATAQADGLMSATDKTSLDALVSWQSALVDADSEQY